MRYHNLLAAGIAFASAAAAQFIFPESSSNLQVNQAVQIRWNKANLQEPLSINLVPAGQVIRQDVVLQQVAVNIGNVGLFQWSADQTISAFPKFAMVIVDARSQVVVSQKFAISGLTKQPNQQIDLGNNGGNAGGKKNNNNNNGNNNNNNKNEKQKDKAKNNDNDKNGNSCDGGNQNDDKKKQQQNNSNNNNNNKGSSTLLPLPGLPPNGAPPVSLKPLPNAAESAPASKPAAAAPTPTAAESSASPAAPAAGNEASPTSKPAPAVAEPAPAAAPEQPELEPAAAEPVPTTAAASETVKGQPEPAQPAANGFTTLQPSADPASAPAKQVKAVVAAPVPESTLKAEALAAGKYFREKASTTTTSDVVFLTALGAQAGQDKTISTAITPVAPARFAASNAGGGAEETQDSLAPDDAKPTVLSGEKSGAEKKVPGLALGLLGVVVAGVALM
ncbi:hypothetical protein NHJ13734_003687 [Beauveria thailandica]